MSTATETFEQFMARTLHHPENGYYRRGLLTVGRSGDFSTSASMLPELSQAIARWLILKADLQALERPVHVIEVGGGTGQLMKSVLQHLGWWKRRRFRFHSVERSAPLEMSQRKLLKSYGVQWHADMKAALDECGGKALIYSNELVDAFPCVVLGHEEGCWKELSVRREGKETLEEWNLPVDKRVLDLITGISRICPAPKRGQRVEIPWSYREWLESWVSSWREGSLLTIDYGDHSENLCRHYPFGTLRSYFKHLKLEGMEIYRRPSLQDITFDVNFSLLEDWGTQLGLKNSSCQSQADFVAALGVKLEENSRTGEAHQMFKVLEQEISGQTPGQV